MTQAQESVPGRQPTARSGTKKMQIGDLPDPEFIENLISQN